MADAPKPDHFNLSPNVDTDGTSTASAEKLSAGNFQKARKKADEKQAADTAVATALAVAKKQFGKKAKLSKDDVKKLRDDATKDAQNDALHNESEADYTKDWKNAVLDRWDQTGHGDVSTQLRNSDWVNQTPGSGSDAFEDIYAAHVKEYDSWRRPLLHALDPKGGKQLFFDPDWQPEANVSYIDTSGKKQYPDAATDPFWVSNYHKDKKTGQMVGYPPGTWAKVSDNLGNYVWAQAKDSNPSLGVGASNGQIEASPGLWANMHDAAGNNAGYVGSGTTGLTQNGADIGARTFNVDVYPGSDGGVATDAMKPMSPAENEEAGKMLESGDSKSIKDGDDLKRQKDEKANPPKSDQQKSGMLLLKGYPGPDQVLYGQDLHEVGYAHVNCIHAGGSNVKEGSCTVRIGAGQDPLSRITDATKDAKNVVSGALDLDVGGAAIGGQNA